MQSLKKKFGKFAVSNQMASQVVGGTQYCCGGDPKTLCRTNQSTAQRLCSMIGAEDALPL